MDGERAARTADGKVYYVPANMKYVDWKKAFVDGVKDGLTVATVGAVTKALRIITPNLERSSAKTIMIRFVIVWTLAKVLTFRPLGISMKPNQGCKG